METPGASPGVFLLGQSIVWLDASAGPKAGRKKSRSVDKLKRVDDSNKSHPALERRSPPPGPRRVYPIVSSFDSIAPAFVVAALQKACFCCNRL
jgi:hypothetical protein